MKFPQKFYKMSLQEQESYLTELKKKIDQDSEDIMRALATVRGGYKYEVTTEPDRPDLMTMKID
jgi:hypothetical protein